ncbi:ABC transporter permease, partial [Rhizobium johnstonii]
RTAIMARGQICGIITAGIDFVVGAIVGFCTFIIALLLQAGVPVWGAIALTRLMGVAIGAFHGFGIGHMGLPPFIITLAT